MAVDPLAIRQGQCPRRTAPSGDHRRPRAGRRRPLPQTRVKAQYFDAAESPGAVHRWLAHPTRPSLAGGARQLRHAHHHLQIRQLKPPQLRVSGAAMGKPSPPPNTTRPVTEWCRRPERRACGVRVLGLGRSALHPRCQRQRDPLPLRCARSLRIQTGRRRLLPLRLRQRQRQRPAASRPAQRHLHHRLPLHRWPPAAGLGIH